MGWNDNIDIDNLASAIVKELNDYHVDITTGVKKVVSSILGNTLSHLE
jgi:hypothetical protein